ncbi:hypothetical protein GOP47_0030135 [Adiantum capillus-veneris]|nr:hypothetical protein GOP47_0030135 [Adiantum capillus-veneris]
MVHDDGFSLQLKELQMSPLLKKSFDSAKCKTVLQLTGQKLKILRNKHALAVKSLRADVARLLEKGQDSSAKTQVENVFREEKIVALYNLLEQFCQLVISRLESIKSQRECPSDLIEAVSSLIYAASRCGEIEELKKVSSYFTRKYGTEFSLAAKELRSGCGVNTQVIQCLSSLSPSSDIRMKLLKDVAVENKIKWDYDPPVADTSKQPADSHSAPTHPTSGTQASSAERETPASQTSGVLKTVLSSHMMSPPLHNMHQPAKINTNLETKEVHSSFGATKIPTSMFDPYALAKSQGKMDYKVVSDYKGREHVFGEQLNSTKSVKVTHSSRQSRSPGSSKMPHRKQMSTLGKEEVEMQLLELEAAAKIALESASEAAKAARAAVAMVRKDSLNSKENCRLEDTQKPEGKHSESSSVPVFDESSFCPTRDDSMFSPSSDNTGSDLDVNYASVDVQQSSGSQQRSSQENDSAKLNTMLSGWEEPRSTDMATSPTFKSFHNTHPKKEEAHGQEEEVLFIKKEIQEDKTVKNFSSVPQFDGYSSDEALEVETPFYPSQNVSTEQQHGSLFGVVEVQSDREVQRGGLVPQFDDNSNEEASEEETPFYLKGRAAMVEEDYADVTARAPSRKLMAACPYMDDMIGGSSSKNLENTEYNVNLHGDYEREPSDSSANIRDPAFMEEHMAHSLQSTPMTPFSRTRGLSDCEDKNPSIQVRRNLKLCSTISEDAEVASVSSIESYKPTFLEDSSLQSPNTSFGLENGPRALKPGLEIPSPTKYKGMSRRSKLTLLFILVTAQNPVVKFYRKLNGISRVPEPNLERIGEPWMYMDPEHEGIYFPLVFVPEDGWEPRTCFQYGL